MRKMLQTGYQKGPDEKNSDSVFTVIVFLSKCKTMEWEKKHTELIPWITEPRLTSYKLNLGESLPFYSASSPKSKK